MNSPYSAFHSSELIFRLGVTCTDGDFWWDQKSFVLRHLRRSGYGRDAMDEQIQHELTELREVIFEHEGKPVWPGKLFSVSVLSVLWTFVAGEKLSRNDAQPIRLMELLKQRSKAFDISGGWLNAMPFLRFIAPEKTSYNLIKRFNAEIYEFFQPIIIDHEKRFTLDLADKDLIFAFINEMRKSNDGPTNFTDMQLVMVILDLFIGGANSTSFTLDFIMMMLVLYPDVQEKCQTVIDEELGFNQLPSLKDKSKLPYVEAVILEIQRFCNVAPVGGPRRVLRDTMLEGYLVLKNTTVLTGLETVNTDVEYWGDPDVFRPERFLDENNNIVKTERLVFFAQGKRRCLGEVLARACLFMFTVGILQKFNLKIPPGGKCPNKKTVNGLLTSPAPYEIVFQRRK